MEKLTRETKSNIRKDIETLRDDFPFSDKGLTSFIIEITANELIDAEATEVHFEIEEKDQDKWLIVYGNGKGMNSKEQLEEYHNMHSISKIKSEGKVGYAGVGAKILLDRLEYVLTETRSNKSGFHRTTQWEFHDDWKNPKWDYRKNRNKFNFKHGTYIEAKLRFREENDQLTYQFLKDIIQDWYNPILLGFYGDREIYINGKQIQPFNPEGNITQGTINLAKKDRLYYFNNTIEELPENYQGIYIVVGGKVIREIKRRWMPQSTCDENITGYVLTDYLIEFLMKSKCDFSSSEEVRSFEKKIASKYTTWLRKIGAKKDTDKNEQMQKEAKPLGQAIYKVLRYKFKDIYDEIMGRAKIKEVLVPSKKGTIVGDPSINESFELGITNEPTRSVGDAPPYGGVNETPTLTSTPEGAKTGKIQKRPSRVPYISPVWRHEPENPLEAWFEKEDEDVELTESELDKVAVVINMAHPAYIASQTDKKSRSYHTTRCFVKAITDYTIDDEEERLKKSWDLFEELNKAMGIK